MPREHLWEEEGAALCASLTILNKISWKFCCLQTGPVWHTLRKKTIVLHSVQSLPLEPKNYIFEVQQQSKFLFINRRLIRLIFLTKLLKYFQHLFIECGERRDLYHSRCLFNIFVLCPGLLGFSIQWCTYQTCHTRMRGRFVSAMSLYGKVRGINLRAQVFSPGLYCKSY